MDVFNNIEKMTDDQLNEYINKLSIKLSIVQRVSSASCAADQLRALLEISRAQMTDRIMSKAFKQMINSRPPELVTDPDLAAINKPVVTNMNKKAEPINRVRVKRSNKPLSAVDLSPTPKDQDKP